MATIAFTIPGRIRGKGRPRATIRAGHATTYTPEDTRNDEAMVRHFGNEAMRALRQSILLGPVNVAIEVNKTMPPSWSKKRCAETRWVTGKPDADNVVKLICDSLNNIVWKDDSQVAALSFVRKYAELDRVFITIQQMDDAP